MKNKHPALYAQIAKAIKWYNESINDYILPGGDSEDEFIIRFTPQSHLDTIKAQLNMADYLEKGRLIFKDEPNTLRIKVKE